MHFATLPVLPNSKYISIRKTLCKRFCKTYQSIASGRNYVTSSSDQIIHDLVAYLIVGTFFSMPSSVPGLTYIVITWKWRKRRSRSCLREAAAALEEQRDAGFETATNMPAPDQTGEGHANRCFRSTSDRVYWWPSAEYVACCRGYGSCWKSGKDSWLSFRMPLWFVFNKISETYPSHSYLDSNWRKLVT